MGVTGVLKVVKARVDELVLNPRNPRWLRPERKAQLMRTMAAEPGLLEARPVIARRQDKQVIAGNMRVICARDQRGGDLLGPAVLALACVERGELRPGARAERLLPLSRGQRRPVRALGAHPFHRSALLRHSCPGRSLRSLRGPV